MASEAKVDVNDPDIVAEVCARLMCGETTRAITRHYGSRFERDFWKRMVSDKEFAATIARAREAGQDTLTAETINIADDATEENVQSARLRIWARQWYASRLSPKKYGDKVAIGGDPDGTPIQIAVHRGTKPNAGH